MSLKQKIVQDFKQAFKDKNEIRKSVLSLVNSEIKNEEISQGVREKGLDDDSVIKILKKAIKQRRDSIEQYRSGGREELAEKEEAEVKVLEEYLPEQLGAEEIEKAVSEAIQEVSAGSMADLGKVMGAAMGKLKGQADGNQVREIAQKLLQG